MDRCNQIEADLLVDNLASDLMIPVNVAILIHRWFIQHAMFLPGSRIVIPLQRTYCNKRFPVHQHHLEPALHASQFDVVAYRN